MAKYRDVTKPTPWVGAVIKNYWPSDDLNIENPVALPTGFYAFQQGNGYMIKNAPRKTTAPSFGGALLIHINMMFSLYQIFIYGTYSFTGGMFMRTFTSGEWGDWYQLNATMVETRTD